MSREGKRAARSLAAVLVFTGVAGEPVIAQEPVYVRRLVLPVSGDQIGYPQGVTADPHTGEIFVCDSRVNRILIFDADGLFLYEIPGGDTFAAPQDVAVDPEGHLVVTASRDRDRALVELDFDGLFRRVIQVFGLPEGAAEPRISSLALSPTGDRLYLLDPENLRVWIASREGEVTGSIDLAAGLTPKEASEMIPGHVDVYGDTVLVAVSSSSQIRMYDLDGRPLRQVGIRGTARCTLAFPTAAAMARDGELVIVDQQRMLIMRWNPETNRCLGEHIGLGDAPGYLYYPMDLALDRSGRLVVSQGFEGRVQMYQGMTPAPAAAAATR